MKLVVGLRQERTTSEADAECSWGKVRERGKDQSVS